MKINYDSQYFDYVFVIFFKFLSRGSAFFVLIILTLNLSLSEIGTYGLIYTSIYACVFLFSFGMKNSLALLLEDEQSKDCNYFSTCLFLTIFLACLGSIFLYFYLVFSELTSDKLLILFSVGAFFCFCNINVLQAVFLRCRDYKSFNISEAMPKLIFLFFVVVSYLTSVISLRAVMSFLFLASFIGLCYTFYFTFKHYKLSFSFSFPRAFVLIKNGMPFALSLFFITLTPFVIVNVAKLYFDSETAGLIFLAYKYVDIFAEVATAVGVVAFSKTVSSKFKFSAFDSTLKVSWFLFYSSLFLILTLIFFSFLFDISYIENSTMHFSFIMVCCTLPFLCFTRASSASFSGLGFAYKVTTINFLVLSFTVIFSISLSITIGILGLASALLLSRLISFMLHVYYFKIYTGYSWSELLNPFGKKEIFK